MAEELIVKRVSGDTETELSRDAITGDWHVNVERPDEGGIVITLVSQSEPEDPPEPEEVEVDSSPNPDVSSAEIKANEEKHLEEELAAAEVEEFGGGIERRRRAGQDLPVVASSSSPAAAQEVIDTAEALAADAAAAQEIRDEAEKIRAGEELEGQVTVEEAVEEATKEELYERAQELDIEGRSNMNKEELAAAIAEAEQVEEG